MESDSEFSIVEGILPSITDPLETFVLQHEGIFPIHSVLIANNGLAALKAIRSIRKWAFETFDNSKIITLYVMATKDDIESNTEFVRIADGHVEVPSGPNMYNYANVDLIVNTAKDLGVQVFLIGDSVLFTRVCMYRPYGLDGDTRLKILDFLKC